MRYSFRHFILCAASASLVGCYAISGGLVTQTVTSFPIDLRQTKPKEVQIDFDTHRGFKGRGGSPLIYYDVSLKSPLFDTTTVQGRKVYALLEKRLRNQENLFKGKLELSWRNSDGQWEIHIVEEEMTSIVPIGHLPLGSMGLLSTDDPATSTVRVKLKKVDTELAGMLTETEIEITRGGFRN